MIATFYLATESGFGLNLNILDTNVINLAIVIGLLVVYGSKFVGNILNERRSRIEGEITEAESQAQEAAAALADAQQNLAQAQAKAEKIKADAEVTAKKTKDAILAQGSQEIERLKATAVQELDSEKAKVIFELKQRIAALAVDRAESSLKERLDERRQQQLIDRCIASLGGN